MSDQALIDAKVAGTLEERKYEEDLFRTPLSARYGSKKMSENWSETKKFSTWRRLWLELAKAEKVFNFVSSLMFLSYFRKSHNHNLFST